MYGNLKTEIKGLKSRQKRNCRNKEREIEKKEEKRHIKKENPESQLAKF